MDLFDVQRQIMRDAAARGPVVVVGRAGFAVLRGEPGLLSVFLHAPLEHRVRRILKVYKMASQDQARELVLQSDKDRAHFVKAAAGVTWEDPSNYHLCVDTARLGTPGAIEVIYQASMEVARKLEPPGSEVF